MYSAIFDKMIKLVLEEVIKENVSSISIHRKFNSLISNNHWIQLIRLTEVFFVSAITRYGIFL